jgi:hypothetical protein
MFVMNSGTVKKLLLNGGVAPARGFEGKFLAELVLFDFEMDSSLISCS